MKRIVTMSEMKALDSATITEKSVPSCVLMERAALMTSEEIEKRIKDKKDSEKILCICGNGNNGGDGVAIARILFLHGYDASIWMIGNVDHRTKETARQLEIASSYKVPILEKPDLCHYTILVDAVFGVGLKRDVEGSYADVINHMNDAKAYKVAVDLPSGINGDTGSVMGTAVKADLTVTFAYLKAGLCLYPGREYAGETVLADVGIYGKKDDGSLFALEKEDLKLLPKRSPSGNKGTFGKVLVVAGSKGMCGAAYLCASAAFSSGAGMVRIFTVEDNRIPLQKLLPEAMLTCETGEDIYEQVYSWADVLIVGPGLGTSKESEEKTEWFLKRAFEEKKPVILDADGLNLLADHPKWIEYLGEHVILTPHIGEMSRLNGLGPKEILSDRLKTAIEFATKTGAVLVMKDACTVVAGSQEENYVNLSGNAGMATAGSGDVLSGVLAGVICRFLHAGDPISMNKKAALGVYLHGAAGDLAAEKFGVPGMKSSDIIPYIPEVLREE